MSKSKLGDKEREFLHKMHNIYPAIDRTDEAAVRSLVAEGFNINMAESFYTPLIFAVSVENEPMVRLILELKADVNISVMCNLTAMHVAASHGNAEIVRILGDSGAHLEEYPDDSVSQPPIHGAAARGDVKVLLTLLELKANPNLRSWKYEQTPLHEAVRSNHIPIVELLIKYDADPDIENRLKDSPISLAADKPEILIILNEANKHKLSVAALNRTRRAFPMLCTEEQTIMLATTLAANPKTEILDLSKANNAALSDAALEALSNAIKVNRNIKEIIFKHAFRLLIIKQTTTKSYLRIIQFYCEVNVLIANGLKSYPNPNLRYEKDILCDENFQLKMQLNEMERSLAYICKTRLGFFTQEQTQPIPANPSAITTKQEPMQA